MLHSFRQAAGQHGYPASTLTDNGMVYSALETELHRLEIIQKNSRPNHPTTCGKVERFQQTLKKWLRAQPAQPASIAELQPCSTPSPRSTTNGGRTGPCRNDQLPQPPMPRARKPHHAPTGPVTSHHRIRTDKIDDSGTVTLRYNGRLHHIGIGRTHARTHVILIVHDLHIRVVNTASGELLCDLTLDPPSRDYHPPADHPGPPPNEAPGPTIAGTGVSDVLRHHSVLAQNPRWSCPHTRFRGL